MKCNYTRVNITRCVLRTAFSRKKNEKLFWWHIQWVCDYIYKCENSVTRKLPAFTMLYQVQILLASPCEALTGAIQHLSCSLQCMMLTGRTENCACVFVTLVIFQQKPKGAAKLSLYYHSQKIDFSLPLGCVRNPRFLFANPRLWSNDNSSHL